MKSSTAPSPRIQREAVSLLVIALILAALFFLSFFNRFVGIRSGGGEWSGGVAFLAGHLPYRDYFTAGPPLNQIKSALELAIFGKALIVTRFAAVAERLLILTVVFLWLRRLFSARAAAISSLIAIVISAGDKVDPLASYNHDAILFAILCGFAADISLKSRSRWPSTALLAGFFAGLSCLTKQTVGLGTVVAVAVIGGTAVWRLYGASRAIRWFTAYFAGFALPVVAVALYLHHLGVLQSCLHMLFVAGPSAKAFGQHSFLTRQLRVAAGYPLWLLAALVGLMLSRRSIMKSLGTPTEAASNSRRTVLIFAVIGAVVIFSAWALAHTSLHAVHDVSKSAVYFTFIGTGIYGVVALLRAFCDSGSAARCWQVTLFAAVGWTVAFTLSLSWPAFEAMTLPGLGLLVAAAIDGATGRVRKFFFVVLAGAGFIQMREKLDMPFNFLQQAEPAIRFADRTSTLPLLRGMRLPPETVRLLEAVDSAVRDHAKPADTIFTYPEFSPVYPLTGRYPPTWAGSHNIDVVPDSLARADAVRLHKGCPVVVLYAHPTEGDLKGEEFVWRSGQRSGQRDLVAALDAMLADYRLVDTFLLKAGDNPIKLYVRSGTGCSNP